jgi:hypothetical protein
MGRENESLARVGSVKEKRREGGGPHRKKRPSGLEGKENSYYIQNLL